MVTTHTAKVNKTAAQYLAKYVADTSYAATVLDIPCGTGLTGQALVNVGFKNIDGVDLSPDMLKIATEKKFYRKLYKGKITHDTKLVISNESYDCVISVFGLDNLHLDYTCSLKEFIRLLKPDGIMIYYISLRCYDIIDLFEYHINLLKEEPIDLILMEKQYYNSDALEKMYYLICIVKKL